MENNAKRPGRTRESKHTTISMSVFLVAVFFLLLALNFNFPPGLECRNGGYECAEIVLGSFGAACTVGACYALRALLASDRGTWLDWLLLLLNGVPAAVFLFFLGLYLISLRTM